jgi:hypothetical protein
VSSEGSEGKRIDLDLAIVPSVELKGRILSAARLRRCLLAKVRLTDASLEMADLSYSDFDGADLSGANLRGANLRRAHLARASLWCADARPVTLSGGRPWPANFDGADFTGADLRDARIAEAVIHSARFHEAKLDGTGITPPPALSRLPSSKAVERGGQQRFAHPDLIVRTGRGAHVTRYWSVGGLCLHAPEPDFRQGEVVEAKLSLAGGGGATATVSIEILHVNKAKGRVTAVFHQHSDALKTLLRTAFAEHRRMAGQPEQPP